jgi:curved DNA-binding protein CbpA
MTNDPDPRPAEALYLRLEVKPDASRQEIVSAYRRLVHGAHPDTQPGDPEAAQRFREITEAYDILSDPLRRASYDRSHARQTLDAGRLVDRRRRLTAATDHAQRSEPIVLRIDLAPAKPSAVQLWAGQVHVEPGSWSVPTNSSDSFGVPATEIASLLSRILVSWWRY